MWIWSWDYCKESEFSEVYFAASLDPKRVGFGFVLDADFRYKGFSFEMKLGPLSISLDYYSTE